MTDILQIFQEFINSSLTVPDYLTTIPKVQSILHISTSSPINIHSFLQVYCGNHKISYQCIPFDASLIENSRYFTILWNRLQRAPKTLSFTFVIVFFLALPFFLVFFPAITFFPSILLHRFLHFVKQCKNLSNIFLVYPFL